MVRVTRRSRSQSTSSLPKRPIASYTLIERCATVCHHVSLNSQYLTEILSGTACWPCRQRKVKCDNKQPCENCVKREHPQLCSYKPNRSSNGKSTSVLPDTIIGKKRARSFSDAREASRKVDRQDSWPRTMGTCLCFVSLSARILTLGQPVLRSQMPYRTGTWVRTVYLRSCVNNHRRQIGWIASTFGKT